jgi:hypothetical protein
MSFTDSTSSWIYAYKTGSAIDSDSVSASVSQHTQYGTTTLNLQNAAGGSSSNPFTSTADSTSSNSSSASSSSPSSASTASSSSGGGGGTPGDVNMVIMAHAILAPLAFVLFFPMGAMMIRLLSFKGVVWLHAGWMVTTYIIVLGAMGMGVWIAVVTQQLDTYHSIIGLIVVGALLLQPVSGITHHLLYKKTGGANVATYPHIWWGRAIVTLGIINGGFGLQRSCICNCSQRDVDLVDGRHRVLLRQEQTHRGKDSKEGHLHCGDAEWKLEYREDALCCVY